MKIDVLIISMSHGAELDSTLDSVEALKLKNRNHMIRTVVKLNHKNGFDSKSNVIDKLIVKKDKGIFDAMNQILKFIESDYVIFLNAGDCFNEYVNLDEISKVISKKNVVFSDVYLESNTIESKLCPRFLIMPNHQSMLIPSSALKNYEYPNNLPYAGDLDLKIFLLQHQKYVKTGEVIAKIETPGNSGKFTFSNLLVRADDMRKISRKYYGFVPSIFHYLIFLGWYLIRTLKKCAE